MLAEFGQICLILALLIAVSQSVLPMIGASRRDVRLMSFADRAACVQFLLIAASFVALTVIFVTSDFSVKLAATNSHTDKPLLYKITGVWGNHEGSMLLWVLILSLFGSLVPIFGKTLPLTLKSRALAVQGMIGVGFLLFILFTSNPFLRLDPVPINGQGLNPLLQDPGLAFHPPFLYLGYVGFSMPFSFAVAALIEGRVDAVWARWLRPWVLLAWSFLTIGITLGSFWAYYELGWGGWWMWDPVENVSFLPWLAGTALLHSILVLGKRHMMASWTVLLGIAAFSLSLVGTFVVRSGVLVSVHSFAVDPERGVFILALLLVSTGGALGLYALRAHTLRGGPTFTAVSKEGGLVLNNLLLVAATVTVFLGTFYPLIIDAIAGDKISVGAPYFNLTFVPIMLLLIVFMGVAPMIDWRRGKVASLKRPIIVSLAIVAFVVLLATVLGKAGMGAIGFALAAYLAYGTLVTFGRKLKFGKVSFANSVTLLRAQPSAAYGFLIAHLGIAVFTAAVTAMTVWGQEEQKALHIGEMVEVAGYEFTLKSVTPGARENFQFLGGEIDVTKNGHEIVSLRTERRFYPIREMVTTEAGFRMSPVVTLLVSVGQGDAEVGYAVRAVYHPFVVWIWIGALMMALAGFVSLADRRLRFAVPTPAKLPDTIEV